MPLQGKERLREFDSLGTGVAPLQAQIEARPMIGMAETTCILTREQA